ncbi:unnamed protein product [Notodromas monacha]|uniref:Uncharacterized protein n=1 Tax=Notodromas monacha TaxID=399045 RepID=A0A7R9BRR4_9CRUS|nr:unnamed protein product [Notodromas monacha]CAG0918973.1 unnamed protein product [Notodromas monacha]
MTGASLWTTSYLVAFPQTTNHHEDYCYVVSSGTIKTEKARVEKSQGPAGFAYSTSETKTLAEAGPAVFPAYTPYAAAFPASFAATPYYATAAYPAAAAGYSGYSTFAYKPYEAAPVAFKTAFDAPVPVAYKAYETAAVAEPAFTYKTFEAAPAGHKHGHKHGHRYVSETPSPASFKTYETVAPFAEHPTTYVKTSYEGAAAPTYFKSYGVKPNYFYNYGYPAGYYAAGSYPAVAAAAPAYGYLSLNQFFRMLGLTAYSQNISDALFAVIIMHVDVSTFRMPSGNAPCEGNPTKERLLCVFAIVVSISTLILTSSFVDSKTVDHSQASGDFEANPQKEGSTVHQGIKWIKKSHHRKWPIAIRRSRLTSRRKKPLILLMSPVALESQQSTDLSISSSNKERIVLENSSNQTRPVFVYQSFLFGDISSLPSAMKNINFKMFNP